jgi:hypothetical protein
MKSRKIFLIVLLAVLLMGLASGLSQAQGPDGAPPPPNTDAKQNEEAITTGASSQEGVAPVDAGNAPAATLPVTPGLWYKYFTGFDFVSRRPTQYQSVEVNFGGIRSSVGTFNDFVTRLDLTQGARIKEVIFLFVDNAPSDISYWLVRYDPLNNTFADLVSQTTSGASTAVRTQTTTGSPITTIDNRNYTYQLQARTYTADVTHVIKGFRVGYEIPLVYLPLIVRQ